MIPTMAYSYILHSSGKKYLNTQPGRRTPKSSIIFSTVADNYLTFFLAFYLAYLLTFYLTYLLTYLLTFFLEYLLTFCLAYLLTFFLTFCLTFCLAYLLTFFPLRSGSAHCDLEVAVEVRQCPLGSGARGGGPAVHTGIWSSRWSCAHWDLDCEEEAAGAEAEEENSSDKT